ncbi:MAG: sporulation protein YqfD [Clostridia bacterium]|nr:sporulation protein YqfD [Clostridia bacterium]
MHVTLCIEGINLERLLRMAADSGVVVRAAERTGTRTMRVCVRADQAAKLEALCQRGGWACRRQREGIFISIVRSMKARCMLVPALVIAALVVFASSQMILRIQVEGAGESAAQVRRVLAQEGVHAGRLKKQIPPQALNAVLAHRLPGLAHAGAFYAGSTLVIDCRPAIQEEKLETAGKADIVAAQSGIISSIWASAGTPQVVPGQAVHRGQVLIAGYERAEKDAHIPVRAQGQVTARVYVQGEARVSLHELRSVETGRIRQRVTVKTPWTQHVVRDAIPFASQDVSRQIQRVVGLYLPLWREIETYAQTQIFRSERSKSDAASMAQGAAEKIARKQCPPDALILDKWVNYSMIDNEFVYASVVLELEAPIAGRLP